MTLRADPLRTLTDAELLVVRDHLHELNAAYAEYVPRVAAWAAWRCLEVIVEGDRRRQLLQTLEEELRSDSAESPWSPPGTKSEK